ncbi:hypothetical protein J4456_01410 [Candidatus Pacearchaeota archaeon]|nr:hypothetical protein [Candidatus Pacearchaeota archaeon]
MQKIISQEQRARKQKINQLIIGLVLIGLMLFSTIGFAFSNTVQTEDNTETKNINGIEFIRTGDFWTFSVSGYEFVTKHNPEDVQHISVLTGPTLQSYVGKPLYFVGENGEHFSEMDGNVRDRFVQRISNACIDEKDCLENYPMKNCIDDNLIVYREAMNESEKIYFEDNCSYIVSSYANQSEYADALLFKLLGIK